MSSNELKCHEFMESFFMLDKNERLPLRTSLHLLCCKECRTKVRLLSRAEKIAARPLKEEDPVTVSNAEIIDIIDSLHPYWINKIKPVSLKKWIVCGLIMVALFIIFGLYIDYSQLQRMYMWFYLVFGCSVTFYCAMFIGTNLDFFVKRIETVRTA